MSLRYSRKVPLLGNTGIPLKRKLKAEGSGLSHKLGQLKMEAEDGKMRETDVADKESLLRIIQSTPSPKAEPLKQWLAKVGYERMNEITNPEESIERARKNWQKLGRREKWIQRIKGYLFNFIVDSSWKLSLRDNIICS